jgi:hypothetical protein
MSKTSARAQTEGTAAGDFLAQKVRDLGERVSDEVEQIGNEARERAAEGIAGVKLLAGASAAGLVGAIALATLPIIALRRVMPGWAIAVGIAGGAGTAAAVLAKRGLDELGAAGAPVDSERVKNAARDALRSLA